MKKVNNGGEKKIMSEIVVTNVVAIRLPKRRPTGMLTVRANISSSQFSLGVSICKPCLYSVKFKVE